MLAVEGLAAGYGAARVLEDVSLGVDAGEIVALVGSNGAGKTTLLNTVAGLHRPRPGGTVTFEERDVTGLTAARLVRRGLVLVPERRQIWPVLTVADHLRLGAFRSRRDQATVATRRERAYGLFPVLDERRDQYAGTLSGGEQQMLAIARALMAGPRLLLLDEPSLGLAPLVVRSILDVVRRLREEGIAVLLVEQLVAMALGIADRGYVLERGRIVESGAAADLLESPTVRRAYLGVRVEATPAPGGPPLG
jgi:branched-chain amino acid transport system ATP-binding protein